METSIFDNVKFGDKFLTKDGRIAICINPITYEKIIQFGVLNQYDTFCPYYINKETGVLWQNGKEYDGDCDWNIVSRYQEQIDEEKLQKAMDEVDVQVSSFLGNTKYRKMNKFEKEIFMTGYRKAMGE